MLRFFAHGVSGKVAYVIRLSDSNKGNAEHGDNSLQYTNPSLAVSMTVLDFSNLSTLDVWSRELGVRLRSQNAAEKTGVGPYKAAALAIAFSYDV